MGVEYIVNSFGNFNEEEVGQLINDHANGLCCCPCKTLGEMVRRVRVFLHDGKDLDPRFFTDYLRV
ncbi:hypothetical protein SDC9_147970 [bioreactor metagenome]|uniref:Uncharacterized protein n=1 Tax=bioreactor metagenome TaxID=1076179 RepID=A0A645EHM9_9ZZZZ